MNTNTEDFIESKIDNIIKENNIYHVGKVVRINSFIIEATGLEDAFFFEKVFIGDENNIGYVDKIEENKVFIALVKTNGNIKIGDPIKTTGEALEASFSKNAMGMVVDAFGVDRITGKNFNESKMIPIETAKIPIMDRTAVNRPLETGIASIDLMFPIGRGQRQLIIGDKKTGKTQILLDTIVNQKGKNVICVYVSIGKTKKEVKRLYSKLVEKGANAYTQIVAVFNDDTSPLIKLTPYVGLSIAEEYMREGYDVLVCIDDLKKHADACREIALISEKNTGREAYPADIFYTHSRLLEKGCQYKNGGSITILPVVETKGGDITDYISTNIISITDGQIVLSEKNFKKGQKPALDFGLSVSRLGGAVQKDSIKKVGAAVRRELLTYLETADVYQLVKIDAMSKELQEKVFRGKKLLDLLKQPKFSPRNEEKLIQNFGFILEEHDLGEKVKNDDESEILNVDENDHDNNNDNNVDNKTNGDVENVSDKELEKGSEIVEEKVEVSNEQVDIPVTSEEQVAVADYVEPSYTESVENTEVPVDVPVMDAQATDVVTDYIYTEPVENTEVPVDAPVMDEQAIESVNNYAYTEPVVNTEVPAEVPVMDEQAIESVNNYVYTEPVVNTEVPVEVPVMDAQATEVVTDYSYTEPVVNTEVPVEVPVMDTQATEVVTDYIYTEPVVNTEVSVDAPVMDEQTTEVVTDYSYTEPVVNTEAPVEVPVMDTQATDVVTDYSYTEPVVNTEVPVEVPVMDEQAIESVNNYSYTEPVVNTEVPVDAPVMDVQAIESVNNYAYTEPVVNTEVPVETPVMEEQVTESVTDYSYTEPVVNTEAQYKNTDDIEQLLTTEIPVESIRAAQNNDIEQLYTTEIPIVKLDDVSDMNSVPVIEESYTTEIPQLSTEQFDLETNKIVENNMNNTQSIPKITYFYPEDSDAVDDSGVN